MNTLTAQRVGGRCFEPARCPRIGRLGLLGFLKSRRDATCDPAGNFRPAAQRAFLTHDDHVARLTVSLSRVRNWDLHEADVAFEDIQDPYGVEFWPEFKGRDGCRTPMVWENSNLNGGFSEAQALATCEP